MSWKFGHIIFSHNFQEEKAFFFEQIGFAAETRRPSLTYEEVVKSNFEGTAVGFYETSTIISDFFLSRQCTQSTSQLSALDRRLVSLNSYGDILGFYLQGNVGLYGWAYYQKREKIRVHQELSGDILINEGSPLPEEGDRHPVDTIFDLSKRILGVRVDHLIFNSNLAFMTC